MTHELLVRINLSELELQQADTDYVSRHSGNLHPVSNADSELPNQQEVTENGKNHVLECNRHAGCEKPEKCREGPQIRSKSECDNKNNREPGQNPLDD